MILNNEITAILLAGGKSSRMGSDKGLVEINGIPMVQYLINLLQSVFSKTIIISNNNSYNRFGLPVFEDEIKNTGPAGGVLTGLKNSTTDWNLVLACDLLLLDISIIKRMITAVDDFDCIVASHNGNIEPLCALYNKTCLDEISKCITNKEYKLHHILSRLKMHQVEFQDVWIDGRSPFENMNTPGDLEKLKVK